MMFVTALPVAFVVCLYQGRTFIQGRWGADLFADTAARPDLLSKALPYFFSFLQRYDQPCLTHRRPIQNFTRALDNAVTVPFIRIFFPSSLLLSRGNAEQNAIGARGAGRQKRDTIIMVKDSIDWGNSVIDENAFHLFRFKP